MRKIVDPHFMSSPRLRDYLDRARDNTIAATDFTVNETIRASTLEKLLMSTEIIARYPHQVSILKDTAAIVQLDPRGSGQQNRFIDATATAWFAQEFCKLRPQAKKGSVIVQKKLLGSRQQDMAQTGAVMTGTRHIMAFSDTVAPSYTAEERERICAGYTPDNALAARIAADMNRMAQELTHLHPDGGLPDDPAALRHTFAYKFAAAAFMVIAAHGQPLAQTEAREAAIDMHHAVYGLFFDGILTENTQKIKIHAAAKTMLGLLEGKSC